MKRVALLSLIAVSLAICFFMLAGFVMKGYEDCSAICAGGLSCDTLDFHFPDNCAEKGTLLYRNILEYCGIGLLLFSGFFPLLINYRKEQSNVNVTSSILSLGLLK